MVAACVIAAMAAACSRERDRSPPPPVADRVGSLRKAAPTTDVDLHRLATALVSARACEQLRGRWTGIRDAERPTVTGTLWIRGCDVFIDGDIVSFVVRGAGWQWGDFTRQRSRVVRETQRFDLTATVKGTLAIRYDDSRRIMGIAFHPTSVPLWALIPLDTDLGRPEHEQRLRAVVLSAILGAVVRRRTPEVLDLEAWANPTNVTVSMTAWLCTGLWWLSVGSSLTPREPDAWPAPIDLGPGGLAIYGPLPATQAVTVVAEPRDGTPRVSLMCESDARRLAVAFLAGRSLPAVTALATNVLTREASLRATQPRCPVVLVASSPPGRPSRLAWRSGVDAQLLTEPAVNCPRPADQPAPERLAPGPPS